MLAKLTDRWRWSHRCEQSCLTLVSAGEEFAKCHEYKHSFQHDWAIALSERCRVPLLLLSYMKYPRRIWFFLKIRFKRSSCRKHTAKSHPVRQPGWSALISMRSIDRGAGVLSSWQARYRRARRCVHASASM